MRYTTAQGFDNSPISATLIATQSPARSARVFFNVEEQ